MRQLLDELCDVQAAEELQMAAAEVDKEQCAVLLRRSEQRVRAAEFEVLALKQHLERSKKATDLLEQEIAQLKK